MKNVFYFMLKALFVLEIFTFLSWLFGYTEKRLEKKVKVNSKIYNITDWTTNNYNTQYCPISQEVKTIREWNLVTRIEHKVRKKFFKKSFKVNAQEILELTTEALFQMCSVKNISFKISQNSQENNCARVSFLIKL